MEKSRVHFHFDDSSVSENNHRLDLSSKYMYLYTSHFCFQLFCNNYFVIEGKQGRLGSSSTIRSHVQIYLIYFNIYLNPMTLSGKESRAEVVEYNKKPCSGAEEFARPHPVVWHRQQFVAHAPSCVA